MTSASLIPVERSPTLARLRGYTLEELAAVARAGLVFHDQGRTDEARALFAGLTAVNPADAYAWRILGVLDLESGDREGARRAFDRAIALEPGAGAAYAGRAEVHLAMGRVDRARADLRDASRRLEGSDPLFRKVAALLAHVRDPAEPTQLSRARSRQ